MMTSSRNGFRQKATNSKKAAAKELETTVKNLTMAVRVMQIMNQQLATSYQNMQNDMNRLLGVVNNLQYKSNAMQSLLNVDEAVINAKADEIKLTDYNKASDKEDQEKGLTVADVVVADSICIITSTCEDKEKEIFRSKFKLSEAGVPELQEKLVGKKVGDKVEVTLNGTVHTIELLGVRTEPPKEATQAQEATTH
jgi:FtsZ-binding cell division protein ZapB